jgi:glycosyltransferase involved in cell wall biosynthesis
MGEAGREPLRFCLLTTFYPPWSFGGDGVQVQRLANALARRGHRVTVVCSPRAHRMLSRRRPGVTSDGAPVEVVPMDGGPASLLGRYLTGRPVGSGAELLRRLDGDFDVIHFHNPSLLGAPRLLEIGSAAKLYTIHEQWLLCPSHVLWRNNHVCEAPPCLSCEIRHARPPQPWRHTGMLDRSLRHLDVLIAPSRSAAELHGRFADLVEIETLPHFVPPPPASPAAGVPAALRPGRPYFLYAGRLEPIKGVSSLIEAFRHRRSEDLVIAGGGSLERRLRRRAADLPHVRFTGHLSQGELDAVYRGALGVVIPTRGHEVLPLVALEAFARGIPVIVNNFGVLAELAETTGAAVAYDSPAGLAAALEQVASEEALRDELGERGRAAAAETFSEEAHMERYLSLIGRLVAQHA